MKRSYLYKLLILVILAICSYSSVSAAPLVKFRIGNRWIESGIYYADVWADVAPGKVFRPSMCDLHFQFNNRCLEVDTTFMCLTTPEFVDSSKFIFNLNRYNNFRTDYDLKGYTNPSEWVVYIDTNERPWDGLGYARFFIECSVYDENDSTYDASYEPFSITSSYRIGTLRLRVKDSLSAPLYDSLQITNRWVSYYWLDQDGDGEFSNDYDAIADPMRDADGIPNYDLFGTADSPDFENAILVRTDAEGRNKFDLNVLLDGEDRPDSELTDSNYKCIQPAPWLVQPNSNRPVVYSLTASPATYCTGANGTTVSLSGSQSGVTYQLQNAAGPVGSSVNGTGSIITWGKYYSRNL